MTVIRNIMTIIEKNLPAAIKDGAVDQNTIDTRVLKLFLGAMALSTMAGTPLILAGCVKAGIGSFVGMLFSHLFSATIYPHWEQARAKKILSATS